MATRVSAAIVLTGKNLELSRLTQHIGLNPTKFWSEGEQIQKSKLVYKHDGWMLATNKIETLYIQEPVEELFKKLKPALSRILEAITLFNLEPEIQFVIYAEKQHRPALCLNKEIIRLISELGADLDIDFYLT